MVNPMGHRTVYYGVPEGAHPTAGPVGPSVSHSQCVSLGRRVRTRCCQPEETRSDENRLDLHKTAQLDNTPSSDDCRLIALETIA